MNIRYLGADYEEEWNKDLTINKIYVLDSSCILDDVGDCVHIGDFKLCYFEVVV